MTIQANLELYIEDAQLQHERELDQVAVEFERGLHLSHLESPSTSSFSVWSDDSSQLTNSLSDEMNLPLDCTPAELEKFITETALSGGLHPRPENSIASFEFDFSDDDDEDDFDFDDDDDSLANDSLVLLRNRVPKRRQTCRPLGPELAAEEIEAVSASYVRQPGTLFVGLVG